MTKEQVHNRTECLECELPAQERLNYFTGQFLAERDFRDEQSYHLGKHRQHHRYLHGWGTVCGLRVVQHPAPEYRNRFVLIEPGLAIDCDGREIVVREKIFVDLVKYLAPTNGKPAADQHLLISLCYTECKTEFVPALFTECGCDETGCEANRVREGFEVKVRRVAQLPPAPHFEAEGVRLNWTTTINLEKAFRLSLDPIGERLYVLTSTDAGQIMVYDANNHCLLRSIDIDARGVDLAIDPTGHFLYVIRHVADTPGDYFLRVIDVQDLNKPQTVNDLSLSPGPLTNPPQVAVAAADGRVYVLDPNAMDPNGNPNKKVIIWKTDINNALVADVNAAKYAEVTTGADPRTIAVSPDGVWLFIAEAAEKDPHVKAAKIETLTGTPVVQNISIDKKPLLLAVAGDGARLFVATASKEVYAFRVQENFPKIGDGVEVGPDKPVDMAASSTGKWLYVLSQDADANGSVRVLDAEKFKTKPEKAVADPVKVVASPQKLLLSADGRRLYAAGAGVDLQPCGGVSVLEINEDSCSEIFWRALEGCPEFPEDACVPLAAIPNYSDGMSINEREIDNRIRPLAPSTETLRQVMLCALEAGFGQQEPESPSRDPGLEADLTHIQLLSWKHDTEGNPLAKITLRDAQPGADPARGVVIGLNKAVRVFDPNDLQSKLIDRNVFQVLSPDLQAKEPHLLCHCPVAGSVIPVEITATEKAPSGYERITEAKEKKVDDAFAKAVAFLPRQDSLDQIRTANELWVRLRGDFVIDEDGRAIDAAFVRAQLPTGHRQSGGRQGLQGGIFESWFRIKPEEDQPVVTRIALNTATEEELISLPGVGAALAKKIITQRKKAPFKKVEDLLEVSGITENLLDKIRDRVTV